MTKNEGSRLYPRATRTRKFSANAECDVGPGFCAHLHNKGATKNTLHKRETGNTADVSVIVPVHNGEKYLVGCIESIFNQIGDFTMQVIAVNDQSTDKSLQILEGLKKEHLIEIYNTTYGGSAGRARNEGLRHATGEYVMFVDCDDILPAGAIDALYEEILYTHADIVQGSWKYLQKDNKGSIQFFWPHRLTHPTHDADMMQVPGTPWGKIYKRELFDGIGFLESIPCYEDAIIHGIVFERAKDIRTIANVVYEWRQNPNGLTTSTQGTAKGIYSYWGTKELVEMRKQANLPATDFWYRNLILQLSCYCYPCVKGLEEEQRKMVFDTCSALYLKETDGKNIGESFSPSQVERMAAKALKSGNYAAWETVGKLYPALM